jgi:hypothetical protein
MGVMGGMPKSLQDGSAGKFSLIALTLTLLNSPVSIAFSFTAITTYLQPLICAAVLQKSPHYEFQPNSEDSRAKRLLTMTPGKPESSR